MTRRRVLYLPIETKAREFYGKTLLAAKAAERGWHAVLGPQEVVRELLRHGPRGVFIEMSIPDFRTKKLARYHALGHRLANICEESVVYYDALEYCQRKVGNNAIRYIDTMLVAGQSHASDLRKHRPLSAGKIALTGNPRFDTLMPAARGIYRTEAVPLRNKFGRFLMVNTNFMRTNHYKQSPDEMIARLRADKSIVDDRHAEIVRRQYAYKGEQMEKLKPIVEEIARSGRFDNVIIRPHPSENHDTWRLWATPLGIEIIYEGSANSWMLAADAIMHTGCTTGIEGVLLDRPVATFTPTPGHDLLNQADAVSAPFVDTAEFFDLLATWQKAEASSQQVMLEKQRNNLVSLIANVDPPMAADRIMDALDKLDVQEAPVDWPQKLFGNRIFATVQNLRARLNNTRGGYHRQKMPGITEEDILAPIANWVEARVLRSAPALDKSPNGAWMFR